MQGNWRFDTLRLRLFVVVAVSLLLALAAMALVWTLSNSLLLALLLGSALGLLLAFVSVGGLSARLKRGLVGLDHGLLNALDTDYSASIGTCGVTEIDRIASRYNALVDTLRRERQTVYQRELLLDTVIEHSAICVLIADQNDRVIFSNHLARQWLSAGSAINGLLLHEALARVPSLSQAIAQRQNGIVSLAPDASALFHLSCGSFVLNASRHTLVMLREMTHVLNRQEASAWKKVIRVISHELNNSLAPISSLAHSGHLMLQKRQYDSLPEVFVTLVERSRYLAEFVGRYAAIAKLPAPNKSPVEWPLFYQSLRDGYPFALQGPLPSAPGYFDRAQIHQVLQNLLKNAQESGSATEHIELEVYSGADACRLSVRDRGTGMSSAQLEQALLPFYSTKPGGSGTGLSLCREIVEAHGGTLTLNNREEGGLSVVVYLPPAPRA